MVIRNYDPARDFFKSKRNEILSQIKLMLQVKHQCKFPFGVGNITKSDAFTFFRQCRNLRYLLRWHDVFANKKVLDFGAGIGAAYHGLRFCDPKKLIALEPNLENCYFIKQYFHYDEIIQKGWQEYDFSDCEVVFIRNVTIEDWEELAKKLYKSNVNEIVLIERFVKTEDVDVYAEDWLVGETWTPGRFTYDRLIQSCKIPSVGAIRGIFYDQGYTLMNDDINCGDINFTIGYQSFHYRKSSKTKNINDKEFKFIADKIRRKQYIINEQNKKQGS